MKPLFSHGPSPTIQLVFLVIVSLALMIIDHHFKHLNTVRSALALAVYPLQSVVDLPARFGVWVSDNIQDRQSLLQANRELEEENRITKAYLLKLTALEQENIRLRELLQSSAQFRRQQLRIAELLSVDLDPYKQQIVINKGSHHGVRVGQPLLDANGVMGQIIHVTPLNATAILITDPSHALPVQLVRNGIRTLALGTGNSDRLLLNHIPTNSDIQLGDTVSTSGLGGRFPPDYPVAEITKIEHKSGESFAYVEARPLAQLDRTREVLIIDSTPVSKENDS